VGVWVVVWDTINKVRKSNKSELIEWNRQVKIIITVGIAGFLKELLVGVPYAKFTTARMGTLKSLAKIIMSGKNAREIKQLAIDAEELDALFEDMVTKEMIDTLPEEYAHAYKSGQEDMARQFHHELMERGEVVIE